MDWDAWINEVFDNPDPSLYQLRTYWSQNRYNNTYQYMHDTMDTYGAWGVTMGSGVKVAVVDTGVMANHVDLAGKVTEYDIGFGTGDGAGHGTHVAGIIAATVNNGEGGAGIAPDAQIISVRIFAENSRYTSDYYIAKGINKAVEAGADIINLSLGGTSFSQDVQRAISNAVSRGICVVAAMGNSGMNQVNYPAAYDGVIGVVASDANNTRAQYSNYGPWADIAAPGTAIYSSTYDGSFGFMDGTSMACPAVAGAAALYKSVHRDATPKEIEARMKATATKGGKDLGVGIVNAAKMLSEKPTAPVIWAFDDDENVFATSVDGGLNGVIPCESTIGFATYTVDRNWFYVYTLDGKTPAVKNGYVAVGEVYDNTPIDLSVYAGKTVTVKVMQVNGMGMAGAVLTQKIKVGNTWNVTGVGISGPSSLTAGKKGEFTAAVYPVDKADQSVSWSIVSTTASGVTIHAKTGAVTTKATSNGTVRIRAASMTDPSKYADWTFTVAPVYPVKTMTLNSAKETSFVGGGLSLRVASATNTQNIPMPVGNLELRWTSSNPKVASVDQYGNVTALAKGTATITCKVLDGSGKTAKCTVTVKQQVTSLTVTGQMAIAPGNSATYKAAAYPANANDKGVYWSLIGAPAGTTITAGGKVTLPKYLYDDVEAFTVCAVAKDGSGAAAYYSVLVAQKCTRVSIYPNDVSSNVPGPVYNKRGDLVSVGLFNVEAWGIEGVQSQVSLYAWAENGYNVPIIWSSSNAAVASVDANGTVIAHKAGSATITAAAQDGSGKKASVTIKVTVPVSSMELTSSADKGNQGVNAMAIGKTYTHTVAFGSLYGTPTNRKVAWSWDATTRQNGSYADVSGQLAGFVSCSGGKLTVKAGADAALRRYGNLQVTVSAQSTDGTYVTASRTYELVRGATFVKFINGLRQDSDGSYYLTFVSDQTVASTSAGYKFGDFVVTSSNSRVVNPIEVDTGSYSSAYGGYVHWLVISTDTRSGKATITVKTTDGTNKSAKFTVTVN